MHSLFLRQLSFSWCATALVRVALSITLMGCRSTSTGAEKVPVVQLAVEASPIFPGDSAATLVLIVSNPGDSELTVYTAAPEFAFDAWVKANDGREVWRRLREVVRQEPHFAVTIAGRGERRFFASWNLRSNDGTRVQPGDYLVSGVLYGHADVTEAKAIVLRVPR